MFSSDTGRKQYLPNTYLEYLPNTNVIICLFGQLPTDAFSSNLNHFDTYQCTRYLSAGQTNSDLLTKEQQDDNAHTRIGT